MTADADDQGFPSGLLQEPEIDLHTHYEVEKNQSDDADDSQIYHVRLREQDFNCFQPPECCMAQ